MGYYIEEAKKLIGEFELNNESIINERDITSKRNVFNLNGKSNPCRIYMEDKEGDHVPHFHFEIDNKYKGAIKLETAEYFSHGGKYTATFNNSEAKELEAWLNRPYNETVSNWQFMIDTWNSHKDRKRFIPNNVIKPDYSTINNH